MKKITKLEVGEHGASITFDYFEWAPEHGWQWSTTHHYVSLSLYLKEFAIDAMVLIIKIKEILEFLPKASQEDRKIVIQELSDFLEKVVDEDIREKPQIKELRSHLLLKT